jgi:hypothetical protein
VATYRDIKLSDGRGVRVYAPPTIKIAEMVARKYPLPDVPVVEEETRAGKTIRMTIDDDPAYLAEVERVETQRNQETAALSSLFTFRDERPPEEFDAETELGDLVRYIDPEWQPRLGQSGRKLDWVEWVLLANPADAIAVQNTIAEMMGISLEVVEQVEATFPGPMEKPAA